MTVPTAGEMDQLTEELPAPVTVAVKVVPCPADKEAEVGLIEMCPWAASDTVAVAFKLGLLVLVAVTVTVSAAGIVLGA